MSGAPWLLSTWCCNYWICYNICPYTFFASFRCRNSWIPFFSYDRIILFSSLHQKIAYFSKLWALWMRFSFYHSSLYLTNSFYLHQHEYTIMVFSFKFYFPPLLPFISKTPTFILTIQHTLCEASYCRSFPKLYFHTHYPIQFVWSTKTQPKEPILKIINIENYLNQHYH